MGAWDIEPYRKMFYPVSRPRDFRLLGFYSRFFNTVEVNASFYNVGFTAGNARQWLSDVSENPGFTFTVKLFRGLTHTLDATAADVRSIHEFLEPLREAKKLGGVLLQFPFRFVNCRDNRRYVGLLGRIFRRYNVFLEVRHGSWNQRGMADFVMEQGMCPVNIDLPKLPNFMPLTWYANNGVAYFRMMGRNGAAWNHPEQGDRYTYNYSTEELEHLVRLIEIVARSVRRVYVVFHNDAKGHSLLNGFTLRNLLERRGVVTSGFIPAGMPDRTARVFPQLAAFGTASPRGELFDAVYAEQAP
jgi:uncharacterized protein YecE (DUF72 family)